MSNVIVFYSSVVGLLHNLLFLFSHSSFPYYRYSKVRIILLEGKEADALLDLDALSGPTEIELQGEEGSGFKYITKLGVSLRPSIGQVVPSRIVSINPRYVVSNESEEVINVRQCCLEV